MFNTYDLWLPQLSQWAALKAWDTFYVPFEESITATRTRYGGLEIIWSTLHHHYPALIILRLLQITPIVKPKKYLGDVKRSKLDFMLSASGRFFHKGSFGYLESGIVLVFKTIRTAAAYSAERWPFI